MIKTIQKEDKLTKGLVLVLLALLLALMMHGVNFNKFFGGTKLNLQNFSTIFISILLEAIPFIMFGAFISAVIQIFVSEEVIARWIPKNIFAGLLFASLLGFVFPVCECAIIPIARRLIKKGVPLSIAVTFMLSAPLVNPIVLLSTYYAFYNKPSIVIARAVYGLICSMMAGALIAIVMKEDNILLNEETDVSTECYCGCGSMSNHQKTSGKFAAILDQTNIELYNIGKYLIVGAFLSAAFQTLVPRDLLLSFGQNRVLSIIVMMILAFLISICSSADAFIAKSFFGQFTTGSIMAFLILGPMIDLKNTLMLSGTFKKRFVIRLILYIFLLCFFVGTSVNALALLGVI